MIDPSKNKGRKLTINIIVIAIILVVSVFAIISFFNNKKDDKIESLTLDLNTKETLDSLGEDERVNDFLEIYSILQNVDLQDEKKTNTQKLLINEIAKKWNIETAKLTPYTSIDTNTIHFFYELIAPSYYEKAPFQKNSLNINVGEIEDLFRAQGYRYSKKMGENLTNTRIRYYKSNELKGPYCSINYHNKDNAVEYVSFVLFDSQREWTASEIDSHIDKPFDQQMNDMINIALQDINSYRAEDKTPMLNATFTDEEMDTLISFLYQLNEEQLRLYDVLNNEDTVDCLGIWIQATINKKTVIIGFGLNGIDISVQRKDGYTSEFEKKFHSLKQAFWDEPDVVTNNSVPDLVELSNSFQEPDTDVPIITGDDFVGMWQDSYSQRASMNIDYKDNGYFIKISWANSADEIFEWHMTGEFTDNEKNGLNSTDCKKVRIYSESNEIDSEIIEEVIYEDGKVFLFIQDENLYWIDFEEKVGDKCVFEKFE